MVAWQDFFESKPEVCGGEVCAAGTRIPGDRDSRRPGGGLYERRDSPQLSFARTSTYRRGTPVRSGTQVLARFLIQIGVPKNPKSRPYLILQKR